MDLLGCVRMKVRGLADGIPSQISLRLASWRYVLPIWSETGPSVESGLPTAARWGWRRLGMAGPDLVRQDRRIGRRVRDRPKIQRFGGNLGRDMCPLPFKGKWVVNGWRLQGNRPVVLGPVSQLVKKAQEVASVRPVEGLLGSNLVGPKEILCWAIRMELGSNP